MENGKWWSVSGSCWEVVIASMEKEQLCEWQWLPCHISSLWSTLVRASWEETQDQAPGKATIATRCQNPDSAGRLEPAMSQNQMWEQWKVQSTPDMAPPQPSPSTGKKGFTEAWKVLSLVKLSKKQEEVELRLWRHKKERSTSNPGYRSLGGGKLGA